MYIHVFILCAFIRLSMYMSDYFFGSARPVQILRRLHTPPPTSHDPFEGVYLTTVILAPAREEVGFRTAPPDPDPLDALDHVACSKLVFCVRETQFLIPEAQSLGSEDAKAEVLYS